jgi:epoxyqueuosine reductase
MMNSSQGENLAGLTGKVKDFVKKKGATLVGIANTKRFSRAPKDHRPRDFLPNAKGVISIGLRINKSSITQLPKTMREYKINYDVANLKLNSLAWETARFLENLGYEASAIPASSPYDEKKNFGDMSHKHAAVAAGLGRFGMNNLVLTPDYGPYVRFVTVITTAPLRPDRPMTEDICLLEKCLKCVKACPAGALENPVYDASEGWLINKEKCHEYMHIVSGGDVCGLCIKACTATRPKTHDQNSKIEGHC